MFGNFYFLPVCLTNLKCARIVRRPESHLPIHLPVFYHLDSKNFQYSIFNISNQYSILIRALVLLGAPYINSLDSHQFDPDASSTVCISTNSIEHIRWTLPCRDAIGMEVKNFEVELNCGNCLAVAMITQFPPQDTTIPKEAR